MEWLSGFEYETSVGSKGSKYLSVNIHLLEHSQI